MARGNVEAVRQIIDGAMAFSFRFMIMGLLVTWVLLVMSWVMPASLIMLITAMMAFCVMLTGSGAIVWLAAYSLHCWLDAHQT